MTRHALDILARDPDGFFLVIEEERTDEFLHAGMVERAVAAAQGFDEAVRVALEFAHRHPDTLLLVTSDHETAGLAVLGRGNGYENDPDRPCPPTARPMTTPAGQGFCAMAAGTSHTAVAVPLLASGPGATAVHGLLDNTDIARLIVQAFGWDEPARHRSAR